MARLRNGISGGFSGKVGSVIGYRYRDKDCIKGLPKISRKAPSQRQLESRARFKALNDWRNPLSWLFALTFRNHTKSHSAQNAAHRFNLGIVTGEYPDLKVDYSKAVISQGDLAMPEDFKMIQAENGDLEFSWDPFTTYKTNADDLLTVAILCKNKQQEYAYAFTHEAARRDGKFEISAQRGLDCVENFHVYATFMTNDRERAANSVYLGEFFPPEVAVPETPEAPKNGIKMQENSIKASVQGQSEHLKHKKQSLKGKAHQEKSDRPADQTSEARAPT